MIFLVEYDRSAGALVSFVRFSDEQRPVAEDERLALELRLNAQRKDHEVVLLEAVDEPALLRTHQRYFYTLEQLAESGRALMAGEAPREYVSMSATR